MDKREKNISQRLMEGQGKNPFKAPEGYFDMLEGQIMDKIKANEKEKKTKQVKTIRLIRIVTAVAASLALAYLLAYKPLTNNTTIAESLQLMYNDTATYFTMIEESTFANLLFDDEQNTNNEIAPDDVLAYLSTKLNETEIFAETSNN